jgi:hypothetical protein
MNLEKALRDLNAEKRWIEGLIGALEIASVSPAGRLLQSLDRSLSPGASGRGLRVSSRQKTQLAKLSQMVQQDGRRDGAKRRFA